MVRPQLYEVRAAASMLSQVYTNFPNPGEEIAGGLMAAASGMDNEVAGTWLR